MPLVHRLNPLIADVGGVRLWWFGACYALGFLALHLWLRWQRTRLGLKLSEAYELTFLLIFGMLAGGRAVEVLAYEWTFYARHRSLIPALWTGGIAPAGVLLGAVIGLALFCMFRRKEFLLLADELVIPGAILTAFIRAGGFIDTAQTIFLYDALRNLLLAPVLLLVHRRNARRGTTLSLFLVGTSLLWMDVTGLATLIAGVILFLWSRWQPPSPPPLRPWAQTHGPLWEHAGLLIVLLAFCLLIPSGETRKASRTTASAGRVLLQPSYAATRASSHRRHSPTSSDRGTRLRGR